MTDIPNQKLQRLKSLVKRRDKSVGGMMLRIKSEMSDKMLKLGCEIMTDLYDEPVIITQIFDCGGEINERDINEKRQEDIYVRVKGYSGDFCRDHITEVYGSEVMIGDVLRYCDENSLSYNWTDRDYLNKSIQHQSKQTVVDITALIIKNIENKTKTLIQNTHK